jgi:hypothetical protein
MQQLVLAGKSRSQAVACTSDALAPGTREAFARAAEEQMALSIETGSLPASDDRDLAKSEANGLALGQIEALTDAYQTSSAPTVDAISEARVDAEPLAEVKRDGLAAIGRDQNEGEQRCVAARIRYDAAKLRCDWYEANHVANPAWAPFYDRLDVRIRGVVAFEAVIGAGILMSSGAVGAGLETVVPAYGLTTYFNWKLSGYLGRATFRLGVSRLRTKIRLAITVGAAGGTLVLQNTMLGLMRGGLEFSLPALLRAIGDPMTLAPAISMSAVTLAGIGLALAAYVAVQSFHKLNRGFTEEYARLRAEKEEAKTALDAAYEARVGKINVTASAAAAAADDVLEDEASVVSGAREASRRLEAGKRLLCRSVASIARAMERMVNSYNQRVATAWASRGVLPEHYRIPARLDREELRRRLSGAAETLAVARHIGVLTTNLELLCIERGAVKAALADARDRAVARLCAVAYGPPATLC